MGQRPCRRILSRLASTTVEGCIDIERHVQHLLSFYCQTLHIPRIIVGLEHLIDKAAVAFIYIDDVEKLSPLPTVIRLLRQRGMVAGTLEHTNLVLHLNHDDSMFLGVTSGDVVEERNKRSLVGLKHIL